MVPFFKVHLLWFWVGINLSERKKNLNLQNSSDWDVFTDLLDLHPIMNLYLTNNFKIHMLKKFQKTFSTLYMKRWGASGWLLPVDMAWLPTSIIIKQCYLTWSGLNRDFLHFISWLDQMQSYRWCQHLLLQAEQTKRTEEYLSCNISTTFRLSSSFIFTSAHSELLKKYSFS